MEELKKAWIIFGYGMLAIFIVILLIMAATYLISYLAVKLKKQPAATPTADDTKQTK
jgi:Na+-transporting methylmalonyl-CoA/oxaloacetate decarboxylase gamma subunit